MVGSIGSLDFASAESNFVATGPFGRRDWQHTWTRLDSDTGISAEAVRQDPNLLTMFAEPDKPAKAWDGVCGALVNDHIYVTSPNCPLLFDPPLGVNREMWMRNDFRYGQDDPMSWPQPYCASRPHLSCLRLCEKNPSDPDVPLFRLPVRGDFVELDTSSLVRGPGFWARERRMVFDQRCRLILERCQNFARDDAACVGGANRAEELRGLATMFLERLKNLPMTLPRLCLCVAETQRLVLEVEALWTFYTTVRPTFTGIPSSSTPKADVDLVGCFTTDIGVAQQLQRVGVPVWVLRPLEDLVHTRIDKVGVVTKVDGRVHLGTCPLRLPSVYVGSGADEAKYISFDQFTKSHLGIPNVFVWTVGELRTAAALPTKSHAKRKAPAEAVFLPYNQSSRSRKGHLKPEKSNKFLLVTHELLPEISTPWKDALLTVDADKTRIEVPAAPFAFPRPDLFVTISDSAKRMSTLGTWLRLRPGHLAMQTPSYTPAKLSHQMWRTILTYDWVGKSGVEDRVRGKETNRRELAANFMAGCIDEMSVQQEGCTEVVWQGKSMSDLKEEDVHEILWELSELAFRMEFLSLDKHLRVVDTDSAARKHERHLGHCFPRGRYDQCWMVGLGDAHRGISDSSWLRQAPYICSMRRVMCCWKNCLETIRGERSRYTEETLRTVQWEMAVFYCEAFYVAFGRAPILPRRLRHIPDVEDEYPERAVSLSKAPGYYHDVTEWEAPY
ncbi:uncharacterized protein ARMOST_17894 [Armillaria ostoyae]|uniref:Uncharacterized protein n=1 Tax=Armillaria ostoyae TaxID=47428 RepID=A0A284S0D2_ARMOS|nr:uncharacterized protein ARMOST_17894 [Armillaria ostoyae]